jgi:hypothetical protein
MKTQKANQGIYLQKQNNRWKWMAGATAATAAGVSASQAGTITINLVNNYISVLGGNHLNADLTGDGHPDLTIANVPYYHSFYYVTATLNGVKASARYDCSAYCFGHERLGERTAHFSYGHGTSSLMGSIPIFFKDLHINGGAPTSGSLEVTVFGNHAEIRLDSLTYTSNTAFNRRGVAVPDQGSSLALLATGAVGVMALRRRRPTQRGF